MAIYRLGFLIGLLGLLTACQPTTIRNANSPVEAKPIVDDTPKYTSSSYILAEPLPNKKLKISIIARDQDLFIVNCNAYIGINLVDKNNPNNNWGEVTNSCRSQDLIIPKGSTLTFERQLHESFFPLNMNLTYQVSTGVTYNPNQKNAQIPDELRLSNPIKLLP